MKPPPLAQSAATVLAKEDITDDVGELAHPSKAQRAETIDVIRNALATRARERARRRWRTPVAFGGILALSAAAAIVVMTRTTSVVHTPPRVASNTPTMTSPAAHDESIAAESVRGWVYVVRGGARVALSSRAAVGSGESISAVDGDAVFALRSGSKVDVERGTEVAIVSDGETEHIRLERGVVTSRVAKMHGSQRFVVHTPEADVEVRGTIFRVSRSLLSSDDEKCGDDRDERSLRTRVHVEEGRVSVRSENGDVTLDPGANWSSPCKRVQPIPTPLPPSPLVSTTTTTTPTPTPPPPTTQILTAPKTTPSAAAPHLTVVAPPQDSELAAQNALFAQAMTAKSQGDPKRALAFLDAFLDRYPRAPLREAAEAQRMVLLETLDPPRAVSLAKIYLVQYPRGFARADAERIVRNDTR